VIARRWTARATAEGAQAYVAFFRRVLVPQLDGIDGHRGALVTTMAREPGAGGAIVDITVLTFWESMDAIARFAGAAPERAVLEPEARAVLQSFDDRVSHEEVALVAIDARAAVTDRS
jgi:heme-degrading monooxygenase HmoA